MTEVSQPAALARRAEPRPERDGPAMRTVTAGYAPC
jgi:hypothetical protein